MNQRSLKLSPKALNRLQREIRKKNQFIERMKSEGSVTPIEFDSPHQLVVYEPHKRLELSIFVALLLSLFFCMYSCNLNTRKQPASTQANCFP